MTTVRLRSLTCGRRAGGGITYRKGRRGARGRFCPTGCACKVTRVSLVAGTTVVLEAVVFFSLARLGTREPLSRVRVCGAERTDLCYGRVPDSLHKGSSVGLGVVSGGVVGNLMLPVLGGMIGAAVGGLVRELGPGAPAAQTRVLPWAD